MFGFLRFCVSVSDAMHLASSPQKFWSMIVTVHENPWFPLTGLRTTWRRKYFWEHPSIPWWLLRTSSENNSPNSKTDVLPTRMVWPSTPLCFFRCCPFPMKISCSIFCNLDIDSNCKKKKKNKTNIPVLDLQVAWICPWKLPLAVPAQGPPQLFNGANVETFSSVAVLPGHG